MNRYIKEIFIFIFIFSIYFLISCSEKYPSPESKFSKIKESGCTYCHLDAELLKKVAEPLPPSEDDEGEG
ncbi:hypothetical protein DRQ09_04045 [candidate division KSB1 bacterium]|nr:MAG: hypothetical protein DRQ09_04045 [candidate division KSB1 bacterium]